MIDFNGAFKSLNQELIDLTKKFTEAQENTKKFLLNCEKYGIKTLSIGVETHKIKSSQNFTFGVKGNAFADEEFNGWPAIWEVVPEEFRGGAGNRGQYQLNRTANLIEGVYEYKKGIWKKIN